MLAPGLSPHYGLWPYVLVPVSIVPSFVASSVAVAIIVSVVTIWNASFDRDSIDDAADDGSGAIVASRDDNADDRGSACGVKGVEAECADASTIEAAVEVALTVSEVVVVAWRLRAPEHRVHPCGRGQLQDASRPKALRRAVPPPAW